MTKANGWTIVIAILLVVLPYLLTQSEVVVPPIAKLLIQVGILVVGVIARFLPTEPTTVKVEVDDPVPTKPVR